MVVDSELRRRDIEGFCDSPHPEHGGKDFQESASERQLVLLLQGEVYKDSYSYRWEELIGHNIAPNHHMGVRVKLLCA